MSNILHTFDSAEDGYIVHTDGTVTTLGPIMAPLQFWADVDLADAWAVAVHAHRSAPAAQSYYWSTPDRFDWWAAFRLTIVESDDVEITWCVDCRDPHDSETSVSTNYGPVCESCHDENYFTCDDCEKSTHRDHFTYTLSESSVCGSCSDGNYSYCEDCDGYYHHDYGHEHNHGACDCAPPTAMLTMPNGEGTLSANERATVRLPAGIISDEGLQQIATVVRSYTYSLDDVTSENAILRNKWWNFYYLLPTLDAAWQTREGNYTKRLSKLAHKSQGIKVPAEMVAKIGNIARDNSKGADVQVELTRDLNMSAADFYHEDSCWWQSYAESRCALKSNGGIGMRTFGPGSWEEVTGRAWIMPLRVVTTAYGDSLIPTFDGATADAYMVFNGYGDLSGYTSARIVAGMAGMSYRKTVFSCNPMYVNGDAGYLVASEETLARFTDGLRLDVDTHSSLHQREASAARVDALAAA